MSAPFPSPSRSNTMGGIRGRPFNQTAFDILQNNSRADVPAEEVEAALDDLGAPYTVQYTSSYAEITVGLVLVSRRGLLMAAGTLL